MKINILPLHLVSTCDAFFSKVYFEGLPCRTYLLRLQPLVLLAFVVDDIEGVLFLFSAALRPVLLNENFESLS